MAWMEKQLDGSLAVHVVELRGKALWERIARGRRPGRGRARLAGEYPTTTTAAAAYRDRIAQLEAEGYLVVDPNTGVDALQPSGRSVRTRPAGPPPMTIDDFVSALRNRRDSFSEQPALAEVLEALDSTMRTERLERRYKGYACDLGVRGAARLIVQVASENGYWREVGYATTVSVPEDHEIEEERIDADAGTWAGFVAMVRDDPAWQAVADLPCVSVEVVDDEID